MRDRTRTPILAAVRAQHAEDDAGHDPRNHWPRAPGYTWPAQPGPTTDQLNAAEILLRGSPLTLE